MACYKMCKSASVYCMKGYMTKTDYTVVSASLTYYKLKFMFTYSFTEYDN